MGTQLLAGATISVVNFAIHAVITALIVLATRHTARVTTEMGMFARLSSLLTITVLALMCAHIVEITVWTGYYEWDALKLNNATYFEFAFENYTALGYGDALPAEGQSAHWADYGAQWPATDRLVGRGHLRGHADG
jgi:hypothetical protein